MELPSTPFRIEYTGCDLKPINRDDSCYRSDFDLFRNNPIVLVLHPFDGVRVTAKEYRQTLNAVLRVFPREEKSIRLIPSDAKYIDVSEPEKSCVRYRVRSFNRIPLKLIGNGEYEGQSWQASLIPFNPWIRKSYLVQLDEEAIPRIEDKKEQESAIIRMIRNAITRLGLTNNKRLIVCGNALEFAEAVALPRDRPVGAHQIPIPKYMSIDGEFADRRQNTDFSSRKKNRRM